VLAGHTNIMLIEKPTTQHTDKEGPSKMSLVNIIEDGRAVRIDFTAAMTDADGTVRVDLSHLSDFQLIPKRNYAKASVAEVIASTIGDFSMVYVPNKELQTEDEEPTGHWEASELLMGYLAIQNGINAGEWMREQEVPESEVDLEEAIEVEIGEDDDEVEIDITISEVEPLPLVADDEAFVNAVMTEIMCPWTVEVLSDHVESTYSLDLNAKTVEAKRVNSELQFTDEHAKIILKTSLGIRLVIPVLTQWMYIQGQRRNENLLFDVYSRIFDLFSPEGIDAKTKIFKLTESNIYSTRYSDRVIWTYLKNLGLLDTVVARRVYKRLIIDVLPKIDPGQNVIKYLISVIRYQVKYQFRQDFPISFKPVDMMKTDSDGMTEFDKIENSLLRVDEGKAILNRLAIKDEIKRIKKAMGFDIDREELEYYHQSIKVNRLQTNLVFLFFARHVQSYHNLYNITRREYVLLCVLMKKWLEVNGYELLPQVVVAVPQGITERKTINRKEFLLKLTESKSFKRIHEKKYKHSVQNLVDSNIIMKIMATIKGNTLYVTPDFGETIPDEPQEIDVNLEQLASEVLSLVEIV
jgi:hypothetical protein